MKSVSLRMDCRAKKWLSELRHYLVGQQVDRGQSACFENRAWAGACRWEGNIVFLQSSPASCAEILVISTRESHGKPAIAQLVEHLTADTLQ